jgi:hypothetical protein
MTKLSLQEKTCAQSPAISQGKWWVSFVLLAALLFAVTDLTLRLFFHPDPLETPYRSWIASAVADYPASGPKPQIVILGSSLMVAAVNDGDATTLGQEIDGTTHHRSVTLERALVETRDGATAQDNATTTRLDDRAPRSHSFAIGGQMASDAYAILRTLFHSRNTSINERFALPRVIVWGIAPRDLMDATFTDPDISSTVMYLDNLDANHDALGTRKPYIWRQMEYLADACFCTYNQRQHFVALQKQAVYGLLCAMHLMSAADLGTVKTPQELLLTARRELPEDNGIRQWMVKPQRQAITQFEDNSKEYRARYNPFKEKLFDLQTKYLDKFLLLAHMLRVQVLLVNMPLTPGNMALIPAGKYQLYLKTVQELATRGEARFVDFNDGKLFTHEYFNDPVHLNGYGSQRFFQMVAKEIK